METKRILGMKKEKDKHCWMNENERIVSFHPVVNFVLREFETHEAMLQFVLETVSMKHYRIQ